MADEKPDTRKFHHDRQMWLLGATQKQADERAQQDKADKAKPKRAPRGTRSR